MRQVEIPAPRGGSWLGVMLEAHDLGGIPMTCITIRGRAGHMERTWHTCGDTALAYALGQADSRALPLFDFRDGDGE
jgi:hypothetical protein